MPLPQVGDKQMEASTLTAMANARLYLPGILVASIHARRQTCMHGWIHSSARMHTCIHT